MKTTYRSAVIPYIQDLVAQCQAAGIRATADPRSVNPPCVLFVPPAQRRDTMHSLTCEFEALVLVPGPGNLDAFAALEDLKFDVVQSVLHDVVSITPVEFTPDNGPGYPGYTLSWEATLDWDCGQAP